MASLDQEFSSLSAHVSEIVDLVASFKGQGNRSISISNEEPTQARSTFGLGSLGGAAGSAPLTDIIPLKFRAIESEFEYVKLALEQDVVDESERTRLSRKYDGLFEEFKFARSTFRRTQLTQKKSAAAVRNELFGDRINEQIDRRSRSEKKKASAVVSKAEEVTSVLHNVRRLAQTEALVSTLNLESLEESTKNLRTLHEQYGGHNILLNGSKALIRQLEMADTKDRYMMLASLGFLGLVLLWIIWRRILKAPTMLVLGLGRVVVRVGKKVGGVVSKSNVAAGTDGTSLVNTIVTETVKVVTETVMAEAVRVDTETPSVGSGEDYWKTDLAGTIMSGIQDSISDEFIETIVTITGSITTILRETPVVDEL